MSVSSQEAIRKELMEWDATVPREFVDRYSGEIDEFLRAMAAAHAAWKDFDGEVRGSEERAHISALIFGALSLHLISMKLLVWGLLVPAGNTLRQALETVAMALLASKPDLGYLRRYADNEYSTSLAIRDALRNRKQLGLVREALETMDTGRRFYDKFSHLTLMTLATFISFTQSGGTYLGASFDPGKRDAYDKEISTRVQVAGLFENMILGIRRNLAI